MLIFITFLTVIFPLFANYLNNAQQNNSNEHSIPKRLQYLENDFENFKNHNLESMLKISDQEKSLILSKLNDQLESNITNEYLIKLEERLKIKDIYTLTQPSLDRIRQEISSLARRGTVNLFIGITLSILGVFYLIATIPNITLYTDYPSLIYYFLPRVLIVIFIEFFSFFFLNLYKRSLDEIKYFQNEMTNLEGKYLALYLARQSGNFKLLSNALDTLLKTERNFVLKKDETTIELEKIELRLKVQIVQFKL
ncbi:hypothetical protein Q674_05700 [Acinetobacter sp. COS3]|uniref:hypothetical protein n=1 Tax=Acinetobacter sp. COS3 TaxID=1397525 RepID=UPI0003B8A4C3|nr:hypothetical protein [Acinetobacter sp. COS3]ERP96256.1 hypothetical protein Q674_05700 [Acinetobacter sp. COS3]